MVSMKKNHELFWILEVLLLMPIAAFWCGVLSVMMSDSHTLFNAVVGEPVSLLRAVFIAFVCPAAAAWFAMEYIRENKKEKGATHGAAKAIIFIGIATILLIMFYLYGENKASY